MDNKTNQQPLSVILDSAARDIEDYLTGIMQRTGIEADLIELSVYKALSGVQKRKNYVILNSYTKSNGGKDNG